MPDKPQADSLTVPEYVDTLREMETCEICGSEREHGERCKVCNYQPPPDSLDNPDLAKIQENVQKNVPTGETHIEGYPNNQDEAQTPPPSQAAPNNTAGPLGIMSSIDWTFHHPKLGMGKINPIERPVLPNGPPATNEPQETKITNPQQPTTAAKMIAAQKQKENKMAERTADAAALPAAAKPDLQTDVMGVGGVMDASNDEASRADSQVDVLGIGGVMSEVGPDSHESIEESASLDSDDSGFNDDKTTQDSGPTMVWDLNYSDSGVETQEGPVTHEPFPASAEGVKSSTMHTALESEPFPTDGGPDLAGGGAVSGTSPADPVGNADERVDVLDPTTSPDNNSGPTITWTGTDGNKILRQQEPVTNETLEGSDGVKRSGFNSHLVAAIKLADTEIELSIASPENKYNRMQELSQTDPAYIKGQLDAYAKIKTAGLRRMPSITHTASRVPSFNKSASVSESSSAAVPYDESLFL